jgi:hypothetical protein
MVRMHNAQFHSFLDTICGAILTHPELDAARTVKAF